MPTNAPTTSQIELGQRFDLDGSARVMPTLSGRAASAEVRDFHNLMSETRKSWPRSVASSQEGGIARDSGASLVEFAFVLPFLLLLILGTVELSFVFAQYNEVRHGAREGARYAAVSRPDYDGGGGTGDFNDVVAVTCDRINLPNVALTVELAAAPGSSNPPARLDYATLTVTASTSSLTNLPFFSALVPSQLSNSATFRLEQTSGWGSGGGPTACP